MAKRNFCKSFHQSVDSVKLRIGGGIAELTFSSPRKNALSLAMMHDLADKLDMLQRDNDELFGLILTGENQTFCSGFDLSTASGEDSTQIAVEMCATMHSNFRKFSSLPLISVAAIEGYALGGGAELTAWCDHRIMSDTCVIRFLQAKMGVSPGWGGGVALSSIVGRSKAIEILCQTKKMTSDVATEMGYVERVVNPGKTVEEAKELLNSYLSSADGSINALKGIKKALMMDPETLCTSLSRESQVFFGLWGAADNKRAILKSQKNK